MICDTLRRSVSKPNCSISPAGLLCVFAALAAVALTIGIGFAMLGAWLILPFAGLEIVALGIAFVANARRIAGDGRTQAKRRQPV